MIQVIYNSFALDIRAFVRSGIADLDDFAFHEMRKPPEVFILERLPRFVFSFADPDKPDFHRVEVSGRKSALTKNARLLLYARCRKFHSFSVAPEPLQVVKIAGFLIEDMHDKVAVIDQDPLP